MYSPRVCGRSLARPPRLLRAGRGEDLSVAVIAQSLLFRASTRQPLSASFKKSPKSEARPYGRSRRRRAPPPLPVPEVDERGDDVSPPRRRVPWRRLAGQVRAFSRARHHALGGLLPHAGTATRRRTSCLRRASMSSAAGSRQDRQRDPWPDPRDPRSIRKRARSRSSGSRRARGVLAHMRVDPQRRRALLIREVVKVESGMWTTYPTPPLRAGPSRSLGRESPGEPRSWDDSSRAPRAAGSPVLSPRAPTSCAGGFRLRQEGASRGSLTSTFLAVRTCWRYAR